VRNIVDNDISHKWIKFGIKGYLDHNIKFVEHMEWNTEGQKLCEEFVRHWVRFSIQSFIGPTKPTGQVPQVEKEE